MTELEGSANDPGTFFARYHAEMTGRARRLLKIAGIPQCAVDADDIVSSAFIDALERWDELSNPRAFIYVKINGKVHEEAKKYVRRARLERQRAADPLRCDGPPVVPDFSAALVDLVRLHVAVRGLPKEQRDNYWVVEEMGYTRQEAAELLGRHPGTVARNVWRAKVALQTVLAVFVAIVSAPIAILAGGVANGGMSPWMYIWPDSRD